MGVIGPIDPSGAIGDAQRQKGDREMTRKTRTGQDLYNKDAAFLQAELAKLRAQYSKEKDPNELKILKDKMATLQNQLDKAREHGEDMAGVQNGRGSALGGGGVGTNIGEYSYGGGSGGSSGGDSAFSAPTSGK